MAHTVEKIGGTSMSRFGEVMDNVIVAGRTGNALYNRIFVVSAYSGITNLLLEDKKTGEPGIYGNFANDNERISGIKPLIPIKYPDADNSNEPLPGTSPEQQKRQR